MTGMNFQTRSRYPGCPYLHDNISGPCEGRYGQTPVYLYFGCGLYYDCPGNRYLFGNMFFHGTRRVLLSPRYAGQNYTPHDSLCCSCPFMLFFLNICTETGILIEMTKKAPTPQKLCLQNQYFPVRLRGLEPRTNRLRVLS